MNRVTRLSLVIWFFFTVPMGLAQTTHAYLWTTSGGMQDLGTLPGSSSSYAFGINRSGEVVGCVGDGSNTAAIGWTQAVGMHYLAGLSRTFSCAYAVNDAGQVVGFSGDQITFHAFLWSRTGGAQDLGTLPGDTTSVATAINKFGEVVGYSVGATGQHAFLWTPSTGMQDLRTLASGSCPTCQGLAGGINDSGVIIGQYYVSQGAPIYAFALNSTSGAFLNLRGLGGMDGQYASVASGVNPFGNITGTAAPAEGVLHAFFWSIGEGMQDLGTLEGGFSWGFGINRSGEVVGSSEISGNVITHAFVWSPTLGMQDLGTLGGANSQGYAINDAGQIVGTADISSERTDSGTIDVGYRRQTHHLSPPRGSLLDPAPARRELAVSLLDFFRS